MPTYDLNLGACIIPYSKEKFVVINEPLESDWAVSGAILSAEKYVVRESVLFCVYPVEESWVEQPRPEHFKIYDIIKFYSKYYIYIMLYYFKCDV